IEDMSNKDSISTSKEPKEEPMDDFQSMLPYNELNSTIKEEEMYEHEEVRIYMTNEPKEEPPSDCDQPFGIDLGDEIKEEELLNDDLMEPKEELIDATFSVVNQQFALDFMDELKDEPILNEDIGNDIGDLDSTE
ncbi:hypothetical protein PMAYCL1PPCAC_20825, partial [Pristionchus mayeri]